MNVTFSEICRAVLLYTSGVTTFQRMVLRGEGRPPHIPPQTDPTVGLLRNMWRSSKFSANHQKATDFL